MNNVNFAAVKQMAATCDAMQKLLSDDREIRDLHIIGAFQFPEEHGSQIAAAAKQGRSTVVVTFTRDGTDALVDKILLMKAASNKKSMSISFCSFVQSDDGRFALRLAGREQAVENVYSRSSKRLVCRSVKNDKGRAIAELNGLNALLAKAASADCKRHGFQVG